MHWSLPAAIAILLWGIASFAIVLPLRQRHRRSFWRRNDRRRAGLFRRSLAGAAMAGSALVLMLLLQRWTSGLRARRNSQHATGRLASIAA